MMKPENETAYDEKVAQAFVRETRQALQQELRRIKHCLGQLNDQEVWQRPAPGVNAIGTIILHLCGNLRQWFLHGIDGAKDVRDRPAEFRGDTGISKDELLVMFESLIRQIDELLVRGISSSDLLAPRRIQGFETDGLSAIYSTLTHLEGHALQIAYVAHMLVGERYEPFWKPKNMEQGV
jgi:hypothetical protein